MAETPQTTQGNELAARTETGDLINQTAGPLSQEPTKTDTISTDPKPEPTTEEGKTLLGKEGKTEEPKSAAPDKYEFKAPEGWDKKGWKLDDAVIEKATPIFKEMGLSQDAAQKLVSLYAEQSAAAHEASINQVSEQQKSWRKEVISDSALGDGTGLKPTVKAAIANVIDTHMGPAAKSFREALDFTGAGDNPAVIRGLMALSERLGEGRQVKGSGPSSFGQRAPEASTGPGSRAMYPNLPSATGG